MVNHYIRNLIKDLGIIVFSVFVAIIFSKSGAIQAFLTVVGGFDIWGAFLAGLFFTSVFTVAPAATVLIAIAQSTGAVALVALLGGLGAMLGDLVIFKFFRDSISADMMGIL